MIRVRTGSRLHFGLFSLPSEDAGAWLNHEGQATLPRRKFGGVGLMVDQPGIELSVEHAEAWQADGPHAARALRFAKAYCDAVGITSAFQLRVTSAAPEHAGLGTGTQLGLAVATAIAELAGQQARDAVALASQIGRGMRSALGVHGFARGGFLVEGGKTSDASISPLLIRCEFPEDWRILLITPRDLTGTHGRREIDAFAEIAKQPPDDRTTESLCRLVLLGMLPALAEEDLQTFGETLYDFNRRVGAMFQFAQRGLYADPRIEQIVKSIREFGVKGVGQSSWGATIFALMTADELTPISSRLMLRHGIAKEEMTFTAACRQGAVLSTRS